ncbi:hypothetical protein CY35_06G076400 [Sphagnum magellanicum]|nr:hypothetical protein CY35_06G076400 [Sphagnum magellanicum]
MTTRQDKEKGVNVQVLLRCRPFNDEERKSNAPQVISCYDQRREVTVIQNIASKQIDRLFTFDKVFGPQSLQKDLYDQAVVPIVNEVLEGFNCTIFAYGQTGTGKTYTMEGSGRKTKNGELPADAGVIPRAVQQIFDTLESQNAEYSVKVTYLELYNEELTDLLAPEEFSKLAMDDKSKKPLALMEDGKGGVLVRGLEEEMVTSASEIYHLLDRGSAKRQTAETFLNKQSSRSHSIFSITIHIKEATPEGEELMKCGKLNLVDLAGSENISRSGAKDGRAREAGEINKSLLTLGRVITALVEHLGHIPYRDSKLTRLLRDSLGGRTKTCIIATVSPSVHCLEETLSTLDYAHRAKNIKNKPEVNQKMMKSALIKDLYVEIERLKSELYSAREKNGIYIPHDRYFEEEAEKKGMVEKIERMEFDLETKDKKTLECTQETLSETNENLQQAKYSIEERDFVIANQQEAEKVLAGRAADLRKELEATVQDVEGLFAKIERKQQLEARNQRVVQSFQSCLTKQLQELRSLVLGGVSQQQEQLLTLENHLQSFLNFKNKAVEELKEKLKSLNALYTSQLQSMHSVVYAHEAISSSTLKALDNTVSAHPFALEELLVQAVADAETVLQSLQGALYSQGQELASFSKQQRKAAQQTFDATRLMSEAIMAMLSNMETDAVRLDLHIGASCSAHSQGLAQLAVAYEEHAQKEHCELLASITAMLTTALSQRTKLVQTHVNKLSESVSRDALVVQQGLGNMQHVAVVAKSDLQGFITRAEGSAAEVSSLLDSKQCSMENILQTCVEHTSNAGRQWKSAHDSVQKLEEAHTSAIKSIIGEGLNANVSVTATLHQMHDTAVSDIEEENHSALAFINSNSTVELEAVARMRTTIKAQEVGASDFQNSHDTNLGSLQSHTDHCFNEEYMEDSSTATTPRKRQIHVPSQFSIDALCTPPLETLVLQFRTKNPTQGCDRHNKLFLSEDAVAVRDSRTPLMTLN